MAARKIADQDIASIARPRLETAAARRLAVPLGKVARLSSRDLDAAVDRTMKRFPKTMARLAE